MINSINASQRCQLTYHSFTYAYLCVCVIFGIYLYETNIPFIKYIDEALTYGLFFYYIANSRYKSREFKFFCVIVAFYIIYSLCVGITNIQAILMDVIIQTKPFIVFYCATTLNLQLSNKGKLYIRRLVLALSLLTIALTVADYNFVMNDLFGHPSRYGTFFTLTGFIYYYCSDRSKKALRNTVILWACMLACMKVKSIAFFVIAFFLTVNMRSMLKSLQLNIKTVFFILFGVALMMAFAWERFQDFYIVNGVDAGSVEEMYARPALYYTAWEIIKDYIPFGSGFGTFASYASGVYYSRLYYDYGISDAWGLRPDEFYFISDTYFPTLAQFGVVGVCLFSWFIIRRLKSYWRFYKKNGDTKQMMLMKIIILIYFLIESTSDSTFIQNRGVVMMLVLALYQNECAHKNTTSLRNINFARYGKTY